MNNVQKVRIAFNKEAGFRAAIAGGSKVLPALGKALSGFGRRVGGGAAEFLGDATGKANMRNWGIMQKILGKGMKSEAQRDIAGISGWAPRSAAKLTRFVGSTLPGTIPFVAAEKAILPNAEENMEAGRRQGQAMAAEQFSQMPFLRRAMANDPAALFQNFLQQQAQAAANPFQNNRGRF